MTRVAREVEELFLAHKVEPPNTVKIFWRSEFGNAFKYMQTTHGKALVNWAAEDIVQVSTVSMFASMNRTLTAVGNIRRSTLKLLHESERRMNANARMRASVVELT
jgi:hypothetical protein